MLAAAVAAATAPARLDAADPGRAVPALKIVAFGDSLTSGRGIGRDRAYPALLESWLRETKLPFIVSNHGVSGDTTAGGVRRLRQVLDERPHILILALGANDGLRGVPVAQVRSNLERIIEAAQADGATVLLCGMQALPLYGRDYSAAFHEVYPALARKYRLRLVPFLLQGVVGNQALLQRDMLHPNAAGAQVIAANVWEYLQPIAARLASRR